MKYITRTIKATNVNARAIKLLNGKIELEELGTFTVDGTPNAESILKECRKRFGKLGQYDFTPEVVEKFYRISVDDFMKYAEEVNELDNEN